MIQTKKNKRNNVVLQGAILAIAGLVVRLIGLLYRVPLTRLLGDEGMGYYSNSFDIYMFFLMVASYGFPLTVSKLTATQFARKRYKEAHVIFKSALILAVIFAVVFSCILWFGADAFAQLIKSPKSVYAIKALAPALFICIILGVFKGYFQGMNNMMPTAVSQIFEQIFNAAFSLIIALILVKKGFEYGAAGGTLGTGIGALVALIVLIIIYSLARNRLVYKRINNDTSDFEPQFIAYYWKKILRTAIPIIIGSAILTFTFLIDMVMFQRALDFKGFTDVETVTMYGIYSNKFKVLTRLPVTIATSLSVAIIPSITASIARKNDKEVMHKIDLAIRATLLVAFPATVGEFILAKPILSLLFGTDHLSLAAMSLQIGAISIVFYSLSTLTIGILQGLNKLKIQAGICGIALLIKIVLNFILLYVFNFNLYGAVVANTLFGLLLTFMNLRVINKTTNIVVNIKKTIIIPMIASLFMGAVSYLSYFLLIQMSIRSGIATLISIVLSVAFYSIVLLKLKGVTESDILSFPKGETVVRLLKKFGLLI